MALITLRAAIPAWQQLLITLPDGDLDTQRYNDCGETALAGVILALRNVPVSPASIRANRVGVQGSGLTTGMDLVNMAAYYGVHAWLEAPPPNELEGWITAQCHAQRPSLVLGYWPTPGGVLHWLSTVGCAGRWEYVNSWSGARSWLLWPDAARYYAGQIVAFDQAACYATANHAMPF